MITWYIIARAKQATRRVLRHVTWGVRCGSLLRSETLVYIKDAAIHIIWWILTYITRVYIRCIHKSCTFNRKKKSIPHSLSRAPCVYVVLVTEMKSTETRQLLSVTLSNGIGWRLPLPPRRCPRPLSCCCCCCCCCSNVCMNRTHVSRTNCFTLHTSNRRHIEFFTTGRGGT